MVNFDKLRGNSKINAILPRLAIAYLIVIAVLVFSALDGYSFRPAYVDSLAGLGVVLFAVPTLFALYINRSRGWAGIALAFFALSTVFLPGVLLARILLCFAAVIIFSLSGLQLWQKIVFGLPSGLVALLLLFTFPFELLGLAISQGTSVVTSTAMSPNRKLEVEATGSELGVFSGSTTANLYKIYPVPIIRRLERELISNPNWPARVKIKWIDNKTVEIHGQRFDL